MAANIIENLKKFEIFWLSQGGQKKNFLDFLEIEKTVENKKGVILKTTSNSVSHKKNI